MIDRDKPHVRVTLVRSMVGVKPGTGVPKIGVLRRKVVADAGWELAGFESVTPDEQRGPTALQPTLEKLKALRDAVNAEISEIECYGDPTGDEDDEDFIQDLASGAHYNVEDAWDAYDKHYEGR